MKLKVHNREEERKEDWRGKEIGSRKNKKERIRKEEKGKKGREGEREKRRKTEKKEGGG